jgi:uncharacterized protein (TIGR01777 family)
MNTIFLLLSVQAFLGAFDNLWHHEWQAKLPQRPSARKELALHAVREAIYGVVFMGLAWARWQGALAALLALLLTVELVVTLADFLEEDRTRQLPAFERVLHTVLTITYGLFLGLFAPILWAWWQQPTALVLSDHGWVSFLFTLYALGVWAWSVRNALAVRQLGRQREQQPTPPMLATRFPSAVLITGATGFVGQTLVEELRQEGRRIIVLSRDARQARLHFGPSVRVVQSLDDIASETRIDAIVNLAGARVLGQPWTHSRRRTLLASRVDTTVALVALMRRLEQRPRVLVSASAVGFYGAVNSGEPCTETQTPRPGEFQSDLCAAAEHEARRAEALGVRVVRLRLGVVLGRSDGAYPMLALSSRLGLGAVLGTGEQPAPWLHLQDATGLIRFALNNDRVSGVLNAVAPNTPTQAEFARALATSFGRRVYLHVPAWPLRALGGEMMTLLLDGQNAVPELAQRAGYRYRFASLEGALAQLAERPLSSRAHDTVPM